MAQAPAEETLFGDTVLTIGAIQDPIEETFGWIGDAAVGPDGGIFILDYHLPGISWFDSTGAFVAVMDREGGGPGEVASPAAVAVAPDGHLYVLDRGNVRISEYDLSSDGFDFERSVRHESRSTDLCWLGAGPVVTGLWDEDLVQILDSTGEVRSSFADVARPDGIPERHFSELPDTRKSQINMSLLACDQRSGTIVLVRRVLASVEAFDRLGARLWRTELDGPAVPQWRMDAGEATPWGPDQRSFHEAAAVAIGDDGLVYVTYWEVPWAVHGPDDLNTRLELRIFRLRDGHEVARMLVGGRVFAVRNGLAYMHDRYPFPRVVVVRLKDGAGR